MRYKKHYRPWVWNVLGNVKYKALRGLIAVMLMIVSTIRFFVVSIPKDLCSWVREAWEILYTEWHEVLYDFCNWDIIPDECAEDVENGK